MDNPMENIDTKGTEIKVAAQTFLKVQQKKSSIQLNVTDVILQDDIWQVIVNVQGAKSKSLNKKEQEKKKEVIFSLVTELGNQFPKDCITVNAVGEPIEKEPNKDHLIKRI